MQPTGGSEIVLVVEDDPALRELERLVLEEAGYRVLAAGSGAEALVAAGGSGRTSSSSTWCCPA